MTITQWATYFDVIQDKYGSPYFTNPEKSLLFNRALVQFVDQFFPPKQSEVLNIEMSRDSLAQIAPCIVELPSLNMNTSGKLTKAAIQTSLTGVLAGALLWRELAIGAILGSAVDPVNYVRHQDWYAFLENYFKAPSNTNHKCYETYDAYNFTPVNTITNFKVVVLKYPVVVDIDTVINSDMPDFTHDKVIAIALELAGIASRDEALAQLLDAKKAQL